MNTCSYDFFLTKVLFEQIKNYSVFLYVAQDPSIMIASLIRKKLLAVLSIDTLKFLHEDDSGSSLLQESLFHDSELFYTARSYDSLTKKNIQVLDALRLTATIERPLFIVLSYADYITWGGESACKAICLITSPDFVQEEDIRFIATHVVPHMAPEKLKYAIDVCLQYQMNNIDQISISLLMISLVNSRFMPQIKQSFEKDWLLMASHKQLIEAFISGDKKSFFILWDSMHEDSTLVFWIMFWFDLISKMIYYIRLIHGKKENVFIPANDQHIYTYCKKYSKHISEVLLFDILQNLYEADIRSKDQSESMPIDFLFLDFFLHHTAHV